MCHKHKGLRFPHNFPSCIFHHYDICSPGWELNSWDPTTQLSWAQSKDSENPGLPSPGCDARYRATRDSPFASEPTEITETSLLEACLPCLSSFSCGNPTNSSGPHFSALSASWPWCFPVWSVQDMGCPSPWELWLISYLFNDRYLICWPHHILL